MYKRQNIWNDPHAAQQVFNADWPVTVHGLDVTYKISFSREYLKKIASVAPTVGNFLQSSGDFYIEFYKKQYDFDGCCPHDLLALTFLNKPELFSLENGSLNVITDGDALGQTTINTKVKSNKFIARNVDSDALLTDYLNTIKNAV